MKIDETNNSIITAKISVPSHLCVSTASIRSVSVTLPAVGRPTTPASTLPTHS